VDSWINADKNNVASIHCVGGKGRTGTIIVGVLYYSGKYLTMEDCIQCFARKRSHQKKGIEQPSQLRWGYYFEKFMNNEKLNRQPISINKIIFSGLPPGNKYSFEIWTSPYKGNLVYREIFDYRTQDNITRIFNLNILDLKEDIYIIVYQKKAMTADSFSKLFHVCFHTFFIQDKHVVITKNDLDDADKNFFKILPNDFTMAFTFILSDHHSVEIPDFMLQMLEIYQKRKSSFNNPLGFSLGGLSLQTNSKNLATSPDLKSTFLFNSTPNPPPRPVRMSPMLIKLLPNYSTSPGNTGVENKDNDYPKIPIKLVNIKVSPMSQSSPASDVPTMEPPPLPPRPSSLSQQQKATFEALLQRNLQTSKTQL